MSTARYEKDLELGQAAESFLSSPLGRKIAELAGAEIDRAIAALKTVDPDDAKEIRRLQDVIRRNETLGPYVIEIIHSGQEAKNVLAGEEG